MTLYEKYEFCLNNVLRRRMYNVIFDDGTEVIGIPIVYSMTNLNNETEFSLIVEDEYGNRSTDNYTISSINEFEEI
jgi:hypothetical protein